MGVIVTVDAGCLGRFPKEDLTNTEDTGLSYRALDAALPI